MSDLLSRASYFLFSGFGEVTRKDDELRSVSAQLVFNALHTFVGGATLLQTGFCLQAAIVVRSILETLATVLHLIIMPADLQQFKEDKLELKTILTSAKRVLPPFGYLYGFFSNKFVHIGSIHGQLQPLVPYESHSDELNANVMFLRMSVWLIYVVTELLFIDLIDECK